MIQIYHTQLRMSYTHGNAQFQVISINIPKDNCALSTSHYVAWRYKLAWKRGNVFFFFTLAKSAQKITSAKPSDLLSSNMAAKLSSLSIIIYFPNPAKWRDGCRSRNSKFQIEFDEAVQTLFWSYNCLISGRRVTYQDLESKFWLAQKTIAPPYWNSISRSVYQTLFFSPN